MRKLGIKEGAELVHAARNTIELYLRDPYFKKNIIYESVAEFSEPSGVFVTIYHYPLNSLRGCIGYIQPVMPLGRALVSVAISAAFEDPRFVPISYSELNDITIEVSVLSEMSELRGTEKQKIDAVKIGRDGLYIEYGIYNGILLPTVPVEEHWDSERFLKEVCIKAGIDPNHWKQSNAKLYTYTAQVFREEEPNGKVAETKLG